MADKPMRARNLGIPFEGTPGPLNAITDIQGVEVGHVTLIEGEAIRTGVTAIHPRGRNDGAPCYAGWFSLNGNGEMTGTAWIDESGLLTSPIMLTNTHSVGVVRDAVIAWERRVGRDKMWSLPVVAETYDGILNDIDGFHIGSEHALLALEKARGGSVEEGGVGGGTGMICYGYKGGIGTASREIGPYRVGVLVQANHGSRRQLRLPGKLIGPELPPFDRPEQGSIIGIVATDAPLLPHHCKALAKRAALGLARTGAVAAVTSGDLFLAFSPANRPGANEGEFHVKSVGADALTGLYEAVVQATEEAIWNVLVAARTMTGFRDAAIQALSHEVIRAALGLTEP